MEKEREGVEGRDLAGREQESDRSVNMHRETKIYKDKLLKRKVVLLDVYTYIHIDRGRCKDKLKETERGDIWVVR